MQTMIEKSQEFSPSFEASLAICRHKICTEWHGVRPARRALVASCLTSYPCSSRGGRRFFANTLSPHSATCTGRDNIDGASCVYRESPTQSMPIVRYRVRPMMQQAVVCPVWKRKVGLQVCCRVWVSGVTNVHTQQGWLYLAAVMDLSSRQVVGWCMAPSQPAKQIASALRMALKQHQPLPVPPTHSDRESQCANPDGHARLERFDIRGSMRRDRICCDQAVMSDFFLNLKLERLWRRNYADHGEAQRDVVDYIVSVHNGTHSASNLSSISACSTIATPFPAPIGNPFGK